MSVYSSLEVNDHLGSIIMIETSCRVVLQYVIYILEEDEQADATA
jgi:hypothetical protein